MVNSEIQSLTQEQLDNSILTDKCNQVIIEMPQRGEVTTKNGILCSFNDHVLYAEGKDAHNADCQEVYGVVYRVPSKLYFNPKDNDSMEWETDIEIQKGDLVWFGIMAGANALELKCGEKLYKLISYQDLIVAKRRTPSPFITPIKDGGFSINTNLVPKGDIEKYIKAWKNESGVLVYDYEQTVNEQIIPLNGYILCQTVNCKSISELDVTSEDKIDPSRAIVRYVGTPNKQYRTKSYVDHLDLQAGDEVLIDRFPTLFLERKKYFSAFNGDELYTVVPRRRIACVISREG